jgi:hypothetical protein
MDITFRIASWTITDLILLLDWGTSAGDGGGPAFVEGDYVHPLGPSLEAW